MRNPLTSFEREAGAPPSRRSITGKIIAAALVFVLLMFLLLGAQIFEHVDAGESVVIQYPNGELYVAQNPGYAMQWFGTVEHFRRSGQSEFTGGAHIKTRFNDGAHGYIGGSIRYELPANPTMILDLYRTYRTEDSIKKQLVGQNIMKSVYMTGPLMSSKESYSDRRNELIASIEDQAIHGVFQTEQVTVEVEDPITQQKKWVNAIRVKVDKDSKQVLRQEVSPLERFGVLLYNLTISDIEYDDVVEKQIAAQQQAIMQVQTAIAQSKEAEQQAKTAQAKGQAKAMEAKWEQEALKSKAVVVAEQDKQVAVTAATKEREVADLQKQASEFYKQQQINIGQGDGERKRLAMQANGALEVKVEAWKISQQYWADAFSKYKGNIVPGVIAGGSGPGAAPGNAFQQFMELMSAKAAKDLSLDMSIPNTAAPVTR